MAVFNLGHEAVAWTAPAGWAVVEAVNVSGGGELPPLAGLLLRQAG